ncbi:hypothetical protein UY3_17977 [Chelonia mydas]|uniref:FHF complex subunit HOOK-interacting protein C-terminal domain-containing protein n=1 Tax=Chelonia mydas TaxID=8469 RepID=M7B9L7_CHEMY|nr:hypothetical protein UY3_17977 [Chelonia mydas]
MLLLEAAGMSLQPLLALPLPRPLQHHLCSSHWPGTSWWQELRWFTALAPNTAVLALVEAVVMALVAAALRGMSQREQMAQPGAGQGGYRVGEGVRVYLNMGNVTAFCCSTGITLTVENQSKDYILWTKATPNAGSSAGFFLSYCEYSCFISGSSVGYCESMCIVKYGRAVDISYLQYLWEAEAIILHCMKDCRVWSAPYDGEDPDPDTFIQTLAEENSKSVEHPMFRPQQQTSSNCSSSQITPLGEKIQLELEWDDSYDTGISPGSDVSSPQPFDDLGTVERQLPAEPPKHIQEMKKNAIMLVRGSYIEESDFQDDVMVYRLCAQKDAQDNDNSKEETLSTATESQNTIQSQPIKRSLKNSHPETELKEHNRKNSGLLQDVTNEQINQKAVETDRQPDLELKLSPPEADQNSNVRLLSPDRPFISVVLSKLENMLENSLHVNLLLIGIITQLASYPQPLLRSFLLNTNIVLQPSVRSLYQVLASVKNKIEQFASIQKDFPGLLIQAQQYLLFRADMSDVAPELLTKGKYQPLSQRFAYWSKLILFFFLALENIQHNSSTGKGRNLSEASQTLLQPFLGHRAKRVTALPGIPLPVRNSVLAAALFPEFLKELAALAQEHSILGYKIRGDVEDYY